MANERKGRATVAAGIRYAAAATIRDCRCDLEWACGWGARNWRNLTRLALVLIIGLIVAVVAIWGLVVLVETVVPLIDAALGGFSPGVMMIAIVLVIPGWLVLMYGTIVFARFEIHWRRCLKEGGER